ncbi:hypothetical protein ACJX0J_031821, partial [Zea mays]
YSHDMVRKQNCHNGSQFEWIIRAYQIHIIKGEHTKGEKRNKEKQVVYQLLLQIDNFDLTKFVLIMQILGQAIYRKWKKWKLYNGFIGGPFQLEAVSPTRMPQRNLRGLQSKQQSLMPIFVKPSLNCIASALAFQEEAGGGGGGGGQEVPLLSSIAIVLLYLLHECHFMLELDPWSSYRLYLS